MPQNNENSAPKPKNSTTDTFLNNYYTEYSRCYIIKGNVIPKKRKDWWHDENPKVQSTSDSSKVRIYNWIY